LEPINTYNVKSSISGKVVYINEKLKSKISHDDIVVQIDSKINKIELKQTKIKRDNLLKILKIQESILNSFNKVSSKSKLDKDKQKIIILNTKSTISDLNIKIATLKNIIENKTLRENNTYISDILIQKNDYVNPSTSLYIAQDLTKAKLEIFISFNDINKIKNKDIYINDVKTKLKIYKIYKTADIKHISAYKVEIIVNEVESFSKLVKITFK
jgi:hypothetical protein